MAMLRANMAMIITKNTNAIREEPLRGVRQSCIPSPLLRSTLVARIEIDVFVLRVVAEQNHNQRRQVSAHGIVHLVHQLGVIISPSQP
jgi:hypothetical protein